MDTNKTKIDKFGTEITEIDTTFLLNLENYAQVLYNVLSNPNNTLYKKELDRKDNILETVDSNAFVVKNQMTGLINEMTTEMNSTNIMINNLKTKNALLKEKASNLHKNVLTSDGLFDGELEWYRQQLKIVLVMLIGIIICSVMFYQMNLTVKDKLVAFIIVIVLGTLFTYIANFFVNIFSTNQN